MVLRNAAGDEVTADYLDRFVYKPVCHLEGQTAQSATSGTSVTVQFATSSEVFDDEGWHDTSTNNTRVTPNIAGRYEVWGWGVYLASTTITACNAAIYKNGSSIFATGNHKPSSTSSTATGTPQAHAFVDMNGTTDYLELVIQQQGGSTQTLNTTSSGRSTLIVVLHMRA